MMLHLLASYATYRSFTDCIVLEETMRQSKDQREFLELLLRIRNGTINQKDWLAINERFEGNLSDEEKEAFLSTKVLTVMETWKEVNAENHDQLANLGVPVAVVPSKGTGRHHTLSEKQMGQIVQCCYLAVNSRTLLTKNQIGMTGFGLNNGGIGIIIAILYAKGVAPPDFPEAVVVDFPNYTGPAWVGHHPTRVPIPVNTGRCDNNCCVRRGFPLMPGYAIPIAKSQGMTIGPNNPCTHLRIKLQEETFMEAVSLGTSYTAFSRCSTYEAFTLVQKISQDRLFYINTYPRMQERRLEEQRLAKLSKETIERNQHLAEPEVYLKLLHDFDVLCNDGITTTNCQQRNHDCTCLACKSMVG